MLPALNIGAPRIPNITDVSTLITTELLAQNSLERNFAFIFKTTSTKNSHIIKRAHHRIQSSMAQFTSE